MARMTIRKAEVRMLRAKERKEKETRKERKVIATCYTCGKPGHLAKDCWRNDIGRVASGTARSFSGGASVTTHTVGQQHSQQGSSAESGLEN